MDIQKIKEFYAAKKETINIARFLKRNLGDKVDYYMDNNEVLTGSYTKKGTSSPLRFIIKCNQDQSIELRVVNISYTYENKIKLLTKLSKLISKISIGEEKISYPIAFYNILSGDEIIPCLKWIFNDKEKNIEKLKLDSFLDNIGFYDLFIFDDEGLTNEAIFNAIREKTYNTINTQKLVKKA